LPQTFGARYTAMTGRSTQAGQNPMGYAVAIVAAVVTAVVLEVLAKNVGAASFGDGIVLGVVVWLGFSATLSAVATAFEGRSWLFWAIVNANAFVTFAVM